MNIITLLLVIAAGCLCCWAVVRLKEPARTIGIVVLAVIAFVFLLGLLGLVPGLNLG